DGNAQVLEHTGLFLDGGVIDGYPRVVNGLVHHAEGVGLGRPLEAVHSLGPVLLTRRIDFVDRDDFSWLGLGEEILVVEAPPRRGIAAEALALVGRIRARARGDVDDPHLEDVAGHGAPHAHRAGADVHTETLSRAATEERRVHRPRPAAVDALALPVHEERALRDGLALEH